uniref:F-box domain-containing protein n=1 Tax=Anopheles triannulatus TaxID=58253 RepID=A0A2M4AVZ2_9DIPT
MASKQNYTELLPTEVLCMVFDRLDGRNLKTASLCCKRWNNIIFHSDYIGRFYIHIGVLSNAASKTNPIQSLLQRAKELAHTERRYRKFGFLVMQFMEEVVTDLWKIIHPKHGDHIQMLELMFVAAPMDDLFALMIERIPSMPQLRFLFVMEGLLFRNLLLYPEYNQKNIPLIRSESLEELEMNCKYKYTVDMPRLKVFKGALSGLLPPDTGDAESLVLAKLRDLEVTVESWQPINQSVFRRMPNLVKIAWDIPVADDLFIAMCVRCQSLTEAWFSNDVLISRRSIFDQLSKLTQLRLLSFYSIDIKLHQDVFLDLSKLIHLEDLDLGYTHLMPISLLSLSKSIRKLGLHITARNEQDLMEIMAQNLTQLTELRLSCHPAPISSRALKALASLQQLEVLAFSHSQFTQSFFLGMDAPMPRVRTLGFHHCQLDTKQLLGLQDNFPNVKNPEFLECKITNESQADSDPNDTIHAFMTAFADRLQAAFRS